MRKWRSTFLRVLHRVTRFAVPDRSGQDHVASEDRPRLPAWATAAVFLVRRRKADLVDKVRDKAAKAKVAADDADNAAEIRMQTREVPRPQSRRFRRVSRSR